MTGTQLRASILQMAVQGKLVPQDPADGTAAELIKKIREEKRRLVREGKIKKPKIESEIFRRDGKWFERIGKEEKCIDKELPFEIPESWMWVRLGTLGQIIGGGTPDTSKLEYWTNGEISWITPADMKNSVNNCIERGAKNITELGLKNSSARLMPPNSLLFSTRAPIGHMAISAKSLCTNQGFRSVVPYIFGVVQYLFYALKYFTPAIQKRASGTTFKEISGAEFGNTLIPFPPLAEQKRIVEKLDEILPRVEAYQKARDELASLDKNFPATFKKSILQMAVQGKLVPQDPADGSASELLKKIREEKKRLIRDGKIKKPKIESEIFRRDGKWFERIGKEEKCIDKELPFDIPDSWTWVRLGELGYFIRGNGLKRSDTQSSGVPCVRYGELYTSYNISFLEARSFVSEKTAKELKKVESGDILFTLTGETKDEIGKAVAYLGDATLVAGGDLAIYKGRGQHSLFISYLLNSPYAIHTKASLGKGNIIVHISCDKLSEILIPLPPLAEQKRIAEKVARFMEIERRLAEALEA